MLEILKQWHQRYFSDPEAVVLFFILVASLIVLTTMGHVLAPLFASIVIAYLLAAPINYLIKWRCPRALAIVSVFVLFIGLLVVALFWLLPLLWQQLANLFNEIPTIVNKIQHLLMQLPDYHPGYVDNSQIVHFIGLIKVQLGKFGQSILSASVSSIPSLVVLIVYFILVPLLVIFILFDRENLLATFGSWLPKEHTQLTVIWRSVNKHIGNYVRGKIVEVLIVTSICFIAFGLMGLEYTVLLSVLVGLSTIIPFVGAIVVTIPVVVVAYLQWGSGAHFVYLLVVYGIITTVDANVLVPILFSEAVDLHPVSIIVAILLFGAWWGFWGVFFAIPLAALVKTVFNAWPRTPVSIVGKT